MFKLVSLIVMLLSFVSAKNLEYSKFQQVKYLVYTEFQYLVRQQTYYLTSFETPMINYTKLADDFMKVISDYNISIIKVNYINNGGYIYPIYVNKLEYILSYQIGFINEDFKINVEINRKEK